VRRLDARHRVEKLAAQVLLPVLREALGHDPAHDVGRAARGVANDNTHWLVRKLRFCIRRPRQARHQQKQKAHTASYRCEYIFLPRTGMSATRSSPLSESVM
jgi:hypothetical protein